MSDAPSDRAAAVRAGIPADAVGPAAAAAAAGAVLVLLLGGCAGAAPPVAGSPLAALQARWGEPQAVHPLPAGQRRLEYGTGPQGRRTWMVDVDATGRVLEARQVLVDTELAALQAALPMDRSELLRRIGQPAERRGARGGGQTWAWRYETNDCLWFQVGVDAGGVARDAMFGPDPACDAPNRD